MQPDQDYPVYYDQAAPTEASSQTRRIIVGGSALMLFMLVVVVVVVMLFSGVDIRSKLSEAAAKQQEIARIAELGLKQDGASSTTKNIAATAQATASSHVAMLNRLVDQKYGQALSGKETIRAKNDALDSSIESAQTNNTTDETLRDIISLLCNDSNDYINGIFHSVDDETTITVLQKIIDENTIILESL